MLGLGLGLGLGTQVLVNNTGRRYVVSVSSALSWRASCAREHCVAVSARAGYESSVRPRLQRPGQAHDSWPRMQRRIHVRRPGGQNVEPRNGQ